MTASHPLSKSAAASPREHGPSRGGKAGSVQSSAVSLSVNETVFRQQIVELATLLGWDTLHLRPARTAHGWRTAIEGSLGKGWPDLFLARARDRRVLLAEVKDQRNRLSVDQELVIDTLRAAGLTVLIWRPADWDGIVETLR